MVAVGDHLVFLLAVDQVVVVLHADELVPAVAVGDVLQLLELPGGHAARAKIAHLAGLDDVVERAHDLLAGHGSIEAVDLKYVDVGAEASDGLGDGVEDVFAGEPGLVQHVAVVDGGGHGLEAHVVGVDAEVAFAEDDEALARDGVFVDGFATGVGVLVF